jgi:vacuolar protein sorting-associated protein 13A/C
MVIKMEGGVGKRTVPLLIVESSFTGEVKDWSSKVDMLY